MCLNYERSMKKRHTFGKVCRCISRAMVGVDVRIDLRGVKDAALYNSEKWLLAADPDTAVLQ